MISYVSLYAIKGNKLFKLIGFCYQILPDGHFQGKIQSTWLLHFITSCCCCRPRNICQVRMHPSNHAPVQPWWSSLHNYRAALQLNRCSVRCRCGLLSYLKLDLQKRSSRPGSFTESLVGVDYLLTRRKQGKCLHLHPCWMTDRPRVGENFRTLKLF